jgi:nicotinamidase-related amidase
VPTARAIVPHINQLAAALRQQGGTVAWVNMTAGKGGDSLWSTYHDHFFTPEKAARHRDQLSEGAEGHALYPALHTQSSDWMVWKTRFSPFIAGSSQLDSMLRAKRISNLIVVGTATNMCCESAARDAMMLDYRVIMVADACAARYDEDHMAGLTSFYQSFGDVRLTQEVIDEVLRP